MSSFGTDAPKKVKVIKKVLMKAIDKAGDDKDKMLAALEEYSGKLVSFLRGQSPPKGAVMPDTL
jgi:hypothetical protein